MTTSLCGERLYFYTTVLMEKLKLNFITFSKLIQYWVENLNLSQGPITTSNPHASIHIGLGKSVKLIISHLSLSSSLTSDVP